jgi:hypothetical protein
MATNPMLSVATARAGFDVMLDRLDVGGTGYLKIYSGTIPATCETAATGTLLATLTFSATAFAASTDNGEGGATATANAIAPETNAPATGTAGYFRAVQNDGTTVIFQGTVGVSDADLNLSTVSITIGGQVAVLGLTVVLPGRENP